MGATLRYGSGLLDVPVSSVPPHLTVRATYSSFWASIDRRVRVDDTGAEVGFDPGSTTYHADGAFSVGLFDHAEVGLSLQSLGNSSSGGDMWGLFGRLRLFQPRDQGVGLAVGARYVNRPGFGDGVRLAPGRLGFPDERLVRRYPGVDAAMGTRLTLYGVATAQLRGFDASRIPANDLTLSLGWGGGMFRGAPGAPFYGEGSNGWFAGASSHWKLAEDAVLVLMAEHNGFDVNAGAQADFTGLRVGVHWLGANHARPAGGYSSEYRAPKLGLLASISVCLEAPRLRCRPRTMPRFEPDTIWIPPPPPDTVRIVEGGARPIVEGEASSVCLSTGQNAPIRITAAGDTLVGPSGTPIEELRPVADFAGGYAAGSGWLQRGEDVFFEGDRFVPEGGTFDIDCNQILRVGTFQGVPVFADRAVVRPLNVLFIPIRVGAWRRYERPQQEAVGPGGFPAGSSSGG